MQNFGQPTQIKSPTSVGGLYLFIYFLRKTSVGLKLINYAYLIHSYKMIMWMKNFYFIELTLRINNLMLIYIFFEAGTKWISLMKNTRIQIQSINC